MYVYNDTVYICMPYKGYTCAPFAVGVEDGTRLLPSTSCRRQVEPEEPLLDAEELLGIIPEDNSKARERFKRI